MGRYQDIATKDAFTTVANTDIFTDVVITDDGILRIGVALLTDGDVRITLDGGTTFNSLTKAAGITTYNFFEVPVKGGDVFNMQTVAIEVANIRVILDSG